MIVNDWLACLTLTHATVRYPNPWPNAARVISFAFCRLNLSSGLESLESGLSGLVEEFKSNGGFWSGKTRGENVANMVQLGVKAGLNMAAPILNGIASSVPIMVSARRGHIWDLAIAVLYKDIWYHCHSLRIGP